MASKLTKVWWRARRAVKEFYRNQIWTRLNPQQKWLTDAIGRNFVDKDFLWEIALFRGIVHFWEEDGGERTMRYQYEFRQHAWLPQAQNPEEQAAYENAVKVFRDLDACYRWAKVRDQLWEEFHYRGYDESYSQREQYLIDQDTFFMTELVRLRKYIWT